MQIANLAFLLQKKFSVTCTIGRAYENHSTNSSTSKYDRYFFPPHYSFKYFLWHYMCFFLSKTIYFAKHYYLITIFFDVITFYLMTLCSQKFFLNIYESFLVPPNFYFYSFTIQKIYKNLATFVHGDADICTLFFTFPHHCGQIWLTSSNSLRNNLKLRLLPRVV